MANFSSGLRYERCTCMLHQHYSLFYQKPGLTGSIFLAMKASSSWVNVLATTKHLQPNRKFTNITDVCPLLTIHILSQKGNTHFLIKTEGQYFTAQVDNVKQSWQFSKIYTNDGFLLASGQT